MKFYVKSYREIAKNAINIRGGFHAKKDINGPAFVNPMLKFCGKGPSEFKKITGSGYENRNWYKGVGIIKWNWHISWLIPYPKNKQYLLEFE